MRMQPLALPSSSKHQQAMIMQCCGAATEAVTKEAMKALEGQDHLPSPTTSGRKAHLNWALEQELVPQSRTWENILTSEDKRAPRPEIREATKCSVHSPAAGEVTVEGAGV